MEKLQNIQNTRELKTFFVETEAENAGIRNILKNIQNGWKKKPWKRKANKRETLFSLRGEKCHDQSRSARPVYLKLISQLTKENLSFILMHLKFSILWEEMFFFFFSVILQNKQWKNIQNISIATLFYMHRFVYVFHYMPVYLSRLILFRFILFFF